MVYAGGSFLEIGGEPRNNIAALNAVTGLATDWNPDAGGGLAGSGVHALALSDRLVYAGGDFTTIGGEPRIAIVALDAATGLATVWNPDASGSSVTHVRALALSGPLVFAGGDFTTIGGETRNSIAALDAVTGLATAWNPNVGVSSSVHALTVSGAVVYAGGDFLTIGETPRRSFAQFDALVVLPSAQQIVQYLLTGVGFDPDMDRNGDGVIDVADVLEAVQLDG